MPTDLDRSDLLVAPARAEEYRETGDLRGFDHQPRSLGRDAIRRFTKNKLAIVGMVIVLLLAIVAIFADDWFIALPMGRTPTPLIARTSYNKGFFGPVGAFPSREFWMGTDLNGRDVYSRIVFGARISLSIGLLAQLVALSIGIPLGAIAGWRGGRGGFPGDAAGRCHVGDPDVAFRLSDHGPAGRRFLECHARHRPDELDQRLPPNACPVSLAARKGIH